MGKVLSVVQRRANRFNVENRAHKIISKEKPMPAPMHPYAKEQLEKLMKEHPEIIEQHQQKDPNLQKYLKQVFVTSEDPVQNPDTIQKHKEDQSLLPQNRQPPNEPEFGFHEPAMIPRGRVTLRQALKFITDHQTDPSKWTAESIADKYNLSPQITGHILQYFHTFEVYIPNVEDPSSKIAEPFKSKVSIGDGKSS
ncbi:Protein NDUFAF4 homolog [Gryllus bimaculatus]|nr:Protein NDUFAF4 homolog [Gryllus bimaculatus]